MSASIASKNCGTLNRSPSWAAASRADVSKSSAALLFDRAIMCQLRPRAVLCEPRFQPRDSLRDVAVVRVAGLQLFPRPQREPEGFGIALALMEIRELVERFVVLPIRMAFDLERLREACLGGFDVALDAQALAYRDVAEHGVLRIGLDRMERGERVVRLAHLSKRAAELIASARIVLIAIARRREERH